VIDGAQMNNTLIADYSAIYAANVDRLVIANSAIGWAEQPHDAIRLQDCGDVEIDGVQLGNGVNGLRADNVGRITMRGNSGFASFGLTNVGFSPVAASLDFQTGQYRVGNAVYSQLTDLPGYSYSRSGVRGEVKPGSGVLMFPANTPAIIPGVGYFSRGPLMNRFFSSRALNSNPWLRSGLNVIADQFAAPDLSMTADKLVGASGATDAFEFQGVSPNSGVATVSVFAKMSELRWLILFGNNGGNAAAWFDLRDGVPGTITGAAAVKQSYMHDCGNGWFLCVLVCSTGSQPNAGLQLAEADGVLSITNADGTKGCHAWEASCYNADLPLPPVITTGEQTRPNVERDLMRFALPNGRYIAAYTFGDGSKQSVPVTILDGKFELSTHSSVLRSALVRSLVVAQN
jgi:hypothetical protein